MTVADRLMLLVALAVPISVASLAFHQVADFQSPAEDGAVAVRVNSGTSTTPSEASGLLRQRPARMEAAPPPTLAPPARPTLAPTAVPATPTPAGDGSGLRYTVQRGDELRHIAAQYGVSMSTILAANAIPDPDNLRVGQVLTIPGNTPQVPSDTSVSVAGARAYTVQPGDELKQIAARYGVSMAAILAANQVPDPDNVRAGQVLTIPGG